ACLQLSPWTSLRIRFRCSHGFFQLTWKKSYRKSCSKIQSHLGNCRLVLRVGLALEQTTYSWSSRPGNDLLLARMKSLTLNRVYYDGQSMRQIMGDLNFGPIRVKSSYSPMMSRLRDMNLRTRLAYENTIPRHTVISW